jgi:hypothetical protein
MEKIINATVNLSYLFLVATGGRFAAQKTFLYVQKAALEKAAHGLPPLPRFQ